MLSLGDGFTRWDSACDSLPSGQPLGTAEILVRKLDPKELFTE
jgi:hypothetical protein